MTGAYVCSAACLWVSGACVSSGASVCSGACACYGACVCSAACVSDIQKHPRSLSVINEHFILGRTNIQIYSLGKRFSERIPNKFVGAEMFRTNIRIYSDIKKGTKRIFNY